jgi:ABC-type multidrug transport system fused ATPase/permease subunit
LTERASFLAELRETLRYVSPSRRRQLPPLLGLMLLGAVAEVVSIGALLPFLALMGDPSRAQTNPILRPIVDALHLSGRNEIVLAATGLLVAAVLVAMMIRLLLVRFSQTFVFGVAQELSVAVYRRTLHQPFAFHTARKNIAFGVAIEAIDDERVLRAAQQAELADVIAGLPSGYHTSVGERGVRLSGGQRQRIGIARALYKEAQVLVFDEATSALDNATEKAVMDAINKLDRQLTLLIIAHRLSTVEGCDRVIELEAGIDKELARFF